MSKIFAGDGKKVAAFLPIHCASACYGGSPEFIKLVGGRFKTHSTGVFKATNVVIETVP